MPTAWYLCPYIHAKNGPTWSRRTEIDIYSDEINGSAGRWAEAEINGDKALVYLDAPGSMLNNISKVFPRLTQAEAEAAWTPTRAVPYHDGATDTIKFSTTEFVPCRPLSDVMDNVSHGFISLELAALLALWMGIGFGLGWRLPYDVAYWAARHIGEPTSFWRELLKFTFATDGAFPVNTTVIDNFNRSNESPATGWARFHSGHVQLQVISNQCAVASTTYGSGYWTASTFGPDAELYFSIAAISTVNLYTLIRGADVGGTVPDGYQIFVPSSSTSANEIDRVDNGVSTVLGSTISNSWAAGDSLGYDSIGNNHSAYKKTGGTWSTLGTRSDSTYTAAGYSGWGAQHSNWRIDDFVSGTVAVKIPPPTIINNALHRAASW